jgi:hypothetical protein
MQSPDADGEVNEGHVFKRLKNRRQLDVRTGIAEGLLYQTLAE